MVYCQTKHEAEVAASELLNKLKVQTGWKISVWENDAWHYCIYCGALSVYASSLKGQYYSLMSDDPTRLGAGVPEWTYNHTSDDPNEVIAEQIQRVKDYIAKCQNALDSVRY